MKLWRWSVVLLSVWAIPNLVLAATFTVNSTSATDDGTCTHPFVDAANDCTIEEAIDAANAAAGDDTITFNITTANFADDGDGQFSITVPALINLPSITDQVELTATGMWDSTGTKNERPGVKIESENSGDTPITFSGASANGSKVKGLEIVGGAKPLELNNVDNAVVGTDCDGLNDDKERNVLYGELTDSAATILIDNGSDGVSVKGNYIGIHSDGVTVHTTNLPAGPVSIRVRNSDDVTIGYEEGVSAICNVSAQRNIIGHYYNSSLPAGSAFAEGVRIAGSTSNVRVSGNYIGVASDGTNIGTYADAVIGGHGVVCENENTSEIYIGTDGDGVEDVNEGNVIGNWGESGILMHNCGTDIRVSGNHIGVIPDGTDIANGGDGILARDNLIIGYCDSTINATICSDGGSQVQQGNVIGMNTRAGISIGRDSDNVQVYGNWLGTNATDADFGNAEYGMLLNQQSFTPPFIIGSGVGDFKNYIKFNDLGGIYLDGISAGPSGDALEDYQIISNDIEQNDGFGIFVQYTESYGTAGPDDGIIQDNSIKNNGTYGVIIEGSSPRVDGNTISNNGSYGTYVVSAYKPDDGTYDNPYDALSPNNAANDLVSKPNITDNVFENNGDAALLFLDAAASNADTVATDNTFTISNGTNAIVQQWYVGVELFDSTGAVIGSGTESVELEPNTGTCATCSGSTVADAGGDNALWGPTGILYDNATTWFTVTDYVVDSAGTTTDYNNYNITVDGDLDNQVGNEWSFDGEDNDTNTGGLANGITTQSLFRYQIAEATVSSTPQTPTNINPSDGATNVSRTPTLTSSSFADPTHTHDLTNWDIYSTQDLCTAQGDGNIANVESSTSLTSYTHTSNLTAATTYYWSVRYTNSFGNVSDSSTCTSFTTIRTQPTFTGTIDDQSWNEDDIHSSAFDLDDYFSDQEGEALTFTVSNSEASNISMSINNANVVSFTSADDWNGTGTVTFTACDTDNECVSSNEITLTVISVNDSPGTPDSGFSPTNGDTTSSLLPRISWNAASDVDHATGTLQYQIRIGKTSDPATTYSYSATTPAGRTLHTVTSELDDETMYYYVVRTIDPDDARSDWSDVKRFYVNTTLTPTITLTKEVAIVDEVSASQQALQHALGFLFHLPIPLPAYGSVSDSLLISLQVLLHSMLWLALLCVSLTVVALLALGRSWRNGWRAGLVMSMVVFSSVLAVNASQALVLKLAVERFIQSITVEPNDILEITLTYENSGDGSATSPVFTDVIPSGTSYVSNSLAVQGELYTDGAVNGQTITVSTDTITDSDTSTNNNGTITYQLVVDNPYSEDTLQFAAAGLTANEIDSGEVTSNTASVSVSRAIIIGRVTSQQSGTALNGVTVSILQATTVLSTTTTNSSGYYSLGGFGDGTYTITVTPPNGYLTPTPRTVTAIAGTTYNDINFSLVRKSSGGTDDEDEDETDSDSDQTDDTTDDEDEHDQLLDDGIPEELLDDFNDVPILTDEDEQAIQELTDQFSGNPDTNYQTDIGLDESETIVGGLIDDLQELLFPDSQDLVLEGTAPPNSKIRISICYIVVETESDEQGKWVMVVPEEILQPGENVIYATAEKDGVVSKQIEIARVVVKEPNLISRTVLLGYLSVLIFAITLNTTVYIVYHRRRRRAQLSIHHGNIWVWVTATCMVFSVLAVFGSFLIQHWQTYSVQAASRQPQQGIALAEINQQALLPGQQTLLEEPPEVEFTGQAPADTNIAITLCDNQPLRTTTANSAGNWDVSVPVELLPKARFTVSAQATTIDQDILGAPHRLVDLDITANRLTSIVNALLVAGYVLLLVSLLSMWLHSQVHAADLAMAEHRKSM